MANNCMRHWNGDHLVVLDLETTGLRPGWHEIWQIALLPLDSNLDMRKDVLPFDILIEPEHMERIDWSAKVMQKNIT